MENIDKIIYINLDYRTDRKKEIEEEFEKYNFPKDKIIRFSGILEKKGELGCSKSHYEVIKYARENNFKNVLILEDDFQMVVSREEFDQSLNYFFNLNFDKPWDVLMLAHNIQPGHNKIQDYKEDKMIGRAIFVSSASAYIVNGSYFQKLEEHWKNGVEMLEKTGAFWLYMNDVYWRHLQEKDEWFYLKKRLSIQRESYSDLNHKNVNYKY